VLDFLLVVLVVGTFAVLYLFILAMEKI